MGPTRTILTLLLSSALPVLAQTQPLPQTARQALLEMFFSKKPAMFEKHLPEATRKALRQIDNEMTAPMLQGFSSLGAQIAMGGEKLQTFDVGPFLLVAEEARTDSKFEVTVEQDDLRADEDEIELSFHLYKNGQPQSLPVLPRLTLLMKSEADIWRLQDLTLSARVPLGDPDFLAGWLADFKKAQGPRNEAAAVSSLRMILTTEITYASTFPARGYTCTLSDLDGSGAGTPSEHQAMLIDSGLASGKKGGYVFRLSGCGTVPASSFRVTAVPAPDSGLRAFCSDESGVIRYSADGKAETCLSVGKPLQ